MGKKGDIINLLAPMRQRLMSRPAKTEEELVAIGNAMPVMIMRNPKAVVDYIDRKGLNLVQGCNIVEWVIYMDEAMKEVKTDDPTLTYGELKEPYDKMTSHFIIIHRVNYMLFQTMLLVNDILERDGLLRFNVKRQWNAVEECWRRYERPRQRKMERMAWSTLQDHMRIAWDYVEPRLERVYETLRDYMIRLGWRDVELKARCCVALLMGKVCGTSFRHFFKEFKDETRIDFTGCHTGDDLQPMIKRFAALCDTLGTKTCLDVRGYYILEGINPDDNLRVKKAWDNFMQALRDDDLMDDSARRALELNPTINEKYHEAMAEAEQEREMKKQAEMEEGFKLLEERYKVTKTKKQETI